MIDQMPPTASPRQFSNRVIIVSGAAGKLGRVICKALCDVGAKVAVNDIKAEAVAELASSLKSSGGSVLPITLSATDGDQIVEQTIREFGGTNSNDSSALNIDPESNTKGRPRYRKSALGHEKCYRARDKEQMKRLEQALDSLSDRRKKDICYPSDASKRTKRTIVRCARMIVE